MRQKTTKVYPYDRLESIIFTRHLYTLNFMPNISLITSSFVSALVKTLVSRAPFVNIGAAHIDFHGRALSRIGNPSKKCLLDA